jgi:hypothetical protein
MASLPALLAAALVSATTLLVAVAFRLLRLPAAALFGIAAHLAGLAHVVAILDHELATQAI